MAEHGVVNSVTSAVTGELTSRVFSGLVQRYGKDAATSEKLRRLEMLLIKINSALEASEKLTIENSWLLRWREKLKEAASRGEEVLASFPRSAEDAHYTSNANGKQQQQQQGEAASSSAPAAAPAPATDVGPLSGSFTKNSLAGMVQGIRNARNMLFSRGVSDDMARLNITLATLGDLSLDIAEFIRLLHLEALQMVGHQTHHDTTSLSTKVLGPIKKLRKGRVFASHSNPSAEPLLPSLPLPKSEEGDEMPPVFDKHKPPHIFLALHESVSLPKGWHRKLLRNRLEAAFREISKAIEQADGHDLQDLEWLAYWAGILREAKEQGRDILSTIVIINAKDKEVSMVGCGQEDELSSFVHRLEELARDVEYFEKLVHLCPAC